MEGNGLGKLLKRRRKKGSSIAEESSDGQESRGRSPVGRETTANNDSGANTLVTTTQGGDHGDEQEAASLLSYDSDPDATTTRPSAVSTHPSQIGYLTTSSPLVQAAHLSDSQTSETQPSEPSFRSSGFEADGTKSIESLTTVPSFSSSKTSLGPSPSQPTRRSPSPVGRIKDVFSRTNKSSSDGDGPGVGRRSSVLESEPESQSSPQLSSPRGKREFGSVADRPDAAGIGSSSGSARRPSRGKKIDTTKPPRTPPTDEQDTPTIVNTPPTPTDPNHPLVHAAPEADAQVPASSPPARSSISLGSMISQRRGRSGSGSLGPSKLSNITLAPLTPTPENGPTTPSGQGSGFFSSMISAAQNAANTFSNTISNNNIGPAGPKNKGPNQIHLQRDEAQTPDDRVEVESSTEAPSERSLEPKEPAIKTLGMGDLSLSQLGLNEPSSMSSTPVTARFSEFTEARGRSESAPDPTVDPLSEDGHFGARSQTFYESTVTGDRTPPTGSVYEGQSGIHRSGSIRSAIGRRRKRGSSTTTGGTGGGMTIGAAIAAANASLANPSAQANVPKLTGFAVASKKRNRDFHSLFKSVPDDDYLIEDYSCALQREILAHGRLYVSEGHLCFSSNILGWVTTLVMSFDEIVSVEKRSTALVFKNGLEISTLHARHIFASFTSRDSTYDLIVKIWKLGHPGLKSSLNGVRLEGTGGDKTEKVEAESIHSPSGGSASEEDDDSDEGEEVYDEDDDGDDGAETIQPAGGSNPDPETEKAVARKPSGPATTNGSTGEKPKDAPSPSSGGGEFPGPATHAPTDCGDAETHYDKIVGDDVIQAPMGKVFNLMFGPASVSWMSKWLTTEQKCTDLQMEDKKGLGEDNKTRTYNYIKPLGGSIGPKQTKCMVTETLENLDLEKAVNILCSTQNPDVPSGNVFSVKTKYCLSWAENNATRVQINCTVEWTGKSWLKGPIEKGASDGQGQYCKDLFASLKAAVSSRPRSGTLSHGVGGKGKKKGRKGKPIQATSPTSDGADESKASAKKDWGLLEPLHPLLGPIIDILTPLMTGNVVYGLLVGLLVAAWFGFGLTNKPGPQRYEPQIGYLGYPERLAAYEEVWRREESELWEWLEERVGLDRLNEASRSPPRKRTVEPRTVEQRLREEGMDEREVREAIRVTEEKLGVLKAVVERKAEKRAGSAAAKASSSGERGE